MTVGWATEKLVRWGMMLALCLCASGQALAQGEVYRMAPLDNPPAPLPDAEVRALEARAVSGDGEAAFKLGDYYYHAFGVNELPAFKKWMEVSALSGNLNAKYKLYVCYLAVNCGDNVNIAIEWLSQAAEGGLPGAMASYSSVYFDGKYGVKKDSALGVYWLRRAADANFSTARAHLAYRLWFGMGVAQDRREAIHYADLAARSGSPRGEWLLALAYYTGEGGSVDYTRAFELMKSSAQRDFRPAMRGLAILYSEGNGVRQNYAEALVWLKRAAEEKCYECYNEGEGINRVDPEDVEAIAENGILISKYYYLGLGVDKDCNSAAAWLRKGLQATKPKNKADALHLLVHLTREGCGVPRDEIKAQALIEQYKAISVSKQGGAE